MAIFPYVMYWKCPYVWGVGGSKKAKTPLRNIRMVPNASTHSRDSSWMSGEH